MLTEKKGSKMKKNIILIILFCMLFNLLSAGSQEIQGDANAGYNTWGTTIKNGVQKNGLTPPFSSYIVLGNDDDSGTQLDASGGYGYVFSNLPSQILGDYNSINLTVKTYPTDKHGLLEFDDNWDISLTYYDNITHRTIIWIDIPTTTSSSRNTITQTISLLNKNVDLSNKQIKVEFNSWSEFAIDYVKIDYTLNGKLKIIDDNIPSIVPYTGGSYRVDVQNIGDLSIAYNVQTSNCSASPTSGTLNGGNPISIYINVPENTSTNSKSCYVKINDLYVYFTQEGAPLPPDLDVNLNIPNPVPYEGGSYSGKVYNDGDGTLNWNTSISNTNWIHVSPSSGSTSDYQSITVTIDKNTVENQKEGTIRFYNEADGSDDETFSIRQAAAPPPTGTISGSVKTPSGAGVPGVTVTLSNGPTSKPPILTSSNGTYSFTNLAYGNYRVTPSMSSHEFTPPYGDVSLNSSSGEANFTDQTSLNISGKIYFEGYNCYLEDVGIYKNGSQLIATTDETGNWQSTITIGEDFYIVPKYKDYTFSPARYPSSGTTRLFNDKTDINFAVTTKHYLSLRSETNCGGPITGVEFTVEPVCECFIKTYTVDQSGQVLPTPQLPPLEYKVTAYSEEHPEWFHSDEIKQFSLTKDTTIVFTPLTDLVVSVKDMPVVYNEDNTDSIYAIYSGDSTQINIVVKDTEGCPAKNVMVSIIDDVADKSSQNITVMTDEYGIAKYYLKGGEPAYDNQPDFTKSITFSAIRGDYTANEYNRITENVVVTGPTLITEAFVTGLPEIPIKIIHDPSGDQSYSFFEQQSMVRQEVCLSFQISAGKKTYAKAGIDFHGTGAGIEGYIDANISASSSLTWALEIDERELTTSAQSSTSASVIGPGCGDVYVGIGMNILYGLAKEVIIENCTAILDTNMYWQPERIATGYFYNADHIKNVILKDDNKLLEFYDKEEWEYVPVELADLRARWVQVLNMNVGLDNIITEEEQEYINYIGNKSFSGGGVLNQYSSSVRRTKPRIIATPLALAGSIIGVINPGLGSTMILADIAIGGEITAENITQTETIGYQLNDDDVGDVISVDIYEDLVFGTPVFITKNSVTSCPWERHTSPTQGVSINPIGDVVANVKTNQIASFQCRVSNQNINSTIANDYRVYVPQELNASYAEVRINNINDEVTISIPFNDYKNLGISVKYGSSTIGDTSQIAIIAQSAKDAQISDTIYYRVYWDNEVPPVYFISGTDPYGYPIYDTLTVDPVEPGHLWLWCEPIEDGEPDSVIILERNAGMVHWSYLGKMEKMDVSGHSHCYYRYKYQTTTIEDTTRIELMLKPYLSGAFRNIDNLTITLYPGPEPSTFNIMGNISYCDNSNPLVNDTIYVSGDINDHTTTSAEGLFNFNNVSGSLTLFPSKHNEINSINGFDLLRLKNKLLDVTTLSENALLAADCNGDNSVNGFDLLRLKNYLLMLPVTPPMATWGFTPAQYVYSPIQNNMEEQNFEAFIYGDVNLDWNEQTTSLAKRQTKSNVNIYFDNFELDQNGFVHIPIIVDNDLQIAMLDWTVQIDTTSFFFKSFKSKFIQDYSIKDNILNLVWVYNGEEEIITKGEKIGEIILSPKNDIFNGIIEFSENSYTAKADETPVFIDFQYKSIDLMALEIFGEKIPTETTLYENYPNPFNPTTKISYFLSEASSVYLIIYDIRGIKIFSYENSLQSSGFHNIIWDGIDNYGNPVSSGVYFYQLLHSNGMDVKRMVFMK